MSKIIAALVVVAVCLGSVSVYGAEPSKASLSAMGLSGMQPMSDAQGMKVRGMGVTVWGYSTATANFFGSTANSQNSIYVTGNTFAIGGNLSVAHVGFATAAAGGFAVGYGN